MVGQTVSVLFCDKYNVIALMINSCITDNMNK